MGLGWTRVIGLAFALAACSPDGGGRPTRDGGGGGVDTGTPRVDSGGIDGGRVDANIDVGPLTDVGPRFDADAGCDVTTPVPTQIVGDPPDVLLVVDISGSMCTPLGLFPGGDTKMAVMKQALTDLVTTFDARINFGLMLYPNSSGACDPGTVGNPIMERNGTAINGTISSIVDDFFGCALANPGATPTHTSIDNARTYWSTIPVNPVGRYTLLATDGLPNCGPVVDPETGETAATVDETVTAIGSLNTAGVPTYVVGFGGGFTGDPTALNRMATAGGTGTPFNASTGAALEAAFEAIAAEVIPPSCTIELEGPPRDPMLFQVSFDGGPLIPRNMSRTSGWDYDPATNTITFYGPECDRVQSGAVTNISVDFGCPGPLI